MLDFRPLLKEKSEIHEGSKYQEAMKNPPDGVPTIFSFMTIHRMAGIGS